MNDQPEPTKYTVTSLASLSECGYWYLVKNDYVSHTAFKESRELTRWLDDHGFKLDRDVPPQGTFVPSMKVFRKNEQEQAAFRQGWPSRRR